VLNPHKKKAQVEYFVLSKHFCYMVDFSLQINQEIWVQVTWRKSTLFICINFWHY